MSNTRIYEIGKRLEAKGIPLSFMENRQINASTNIDDMVAELSTEFADITESKKQGDAKSHTEFKNGLDSWSRKEK